MPATRIAARRPDANRPRARVGVPALTRSDMVRTTPCRDGPSAETWPDDSAPNYSVQTTHLKKGTVDHAAKAWSTYGGRVGVWRLMRMLKTLGLPATFYVNARCTEQYPDAVKEIAKQGFDIAAHSYTQDDLPSYKTLEEQRALIRQSIDLLQSLARIHVTRRYLRLDRLSPVDLSSLLATVLQQQRNRRDQSIQDQHDHRIAHRLTNAAFCSRHNTSTTQTGAHQPTETRYFHDALTWKRYHP